ncbi:MAG: serine/threonine protein phosphatase [Beijerinckiaceae bacterium]|nr:serine/threonine protein phosphatase [Beijerinckiaceae bacterium]
MLLGQKIYDVGAWVGFLFVPIVLVVAYYTHHWFEAPARGAIRAWSKPFLKKVKEAEPEPAAAPSPLDAPPDPASTAGDPDHPRIPSGLRIYVIADVHGRADLLHPLLKRIDADMRAASGASMLIFLGDYVDRGPYSAEVIALLLLMQRYKTCVFLAGNHERMLLRFLDDPVANAHWLDNGGLETLRSYGVTLSRTTDLEDLHRLADTFGERLGRHRDFLAGLQTSVVIGDYLFVHAGIRPGVPLPMQASDDLLTIREPFLSFAGNLGKRVVHGHTPVREPDFRSNRINLDCGAFATSNLVCLVLEEDRAFIF